MVVSICGALPGEHPQAHAAGRQVLHGVDQVGAPFLRATHAAVESGPVVAYAGRDVVVEVGRVVDALGPQRVALQVQRLGTVRLRDAGVADQHVS